MMLVLEYLPHGNLRDYLRERSRIGTSDTADYPGSTEKGLPPLDVLLSYAAQIASAMKFLEHHHVLHRDLAARNVLVGEGDRVKLADFGLSRWLNASDCKLRLEIFFFSFFTDMLYLFFLFCSTTSNCHKRKSPSSGFLSNPSRTRYSRLKGTIPCVLDNLVAIVLFEMFSQLQRRLELWRDDVGDHELREEPVQPHWCP